MSSREHVTLGSLGELEQLAIGSEADAHALIERIGEGGMAEVFTALLSGAEGFERLVVIKRLKPHLALNPDTVSRIVSRLRAKRLLAAARRHHLICPSFEALARACPLTPAIVRMHGNSRLLCV